jgi:hypothetical protein
LRDAKKMKSEKIKLNAYLQRNNNKGDGGGWMLPNNGDGRNDSPSKKR